MFLTRFYAVLGSVAMVLVVAVDRASGIEREAGAFYHAYYAEQAERDYQQAENLYEDVVGDRAVHAEIRALAEVRLAAVREELASSDFARLMPPNALAYVELSSPGEQVKKILHQLGLLGEDATAGDLGDPRIAVSPALIEGLLGIRGAAVALTGFNPIKQVPSGVLVFHHGDMEIIRGAIETGLPIAAQPAKPVQGYATYNVEGKVFVTLTSRLVIASTERSQIIQVVRRLKGELTTSLADTPAIAGPAGSRDDALAYFMINAKALMPMVKGMIASQSDPQEMALADALLDFDSLQSLNGQFRVGGDDISLDLTLRLDEGHRSVAFNFLRTAAIDRETLRSVPAGAIAFSIGALNEPPSRNATAGEMNGDQPPPISMLDIGREIFANMTSVALFALPPSGETPWPGVPDVGLVIAVNNPAKSEALWTQILGIASLASGVGAVEGERVTLNETQVRRFEFPGHAAVYFTTVGNDVIVSTTKDAIGRSVQAKRNGQSVLDDKAFANRIAKLSPDCTKAVFVHAGRCAAIAKNFMPAGEAAELAPYLDRLTDTVAAVTVEHGDNEFHFSVGVSGIPKIGDLLAKRIAEERERETTHRRISVAKREGDWNGAAKAIERSLEKHPGDVRMMRKSFEVLAVGKKDAVAARKAADALFKAVERDANELNRIAWTILTEKRYGGAYADIASRFSTRSNELTDYRNWAYLDTLALAKFETGDAEAAVEFEKKAIAQSGDPTREDLQNALKRFEAAVEKKALVSSAG